MCYTTTVIYDGCGHSKTIVREGSECAIGIAQPETQFHWRAPEGIAHHRGICNLCQSRLRRYGCLSPNQLDQLSQFTGSTRSSYSS